MTPNRTRRAVALLTIALLFGAAACSSSDDASSGSSGSSDKSTTTASGGGSGDDSSTTAADDSSGSGSTDDTAAAGKGTVTLVDGEAAADKTITVSKDGEFDPNTLTVAVGEKFTVKAAADAGTHAVTFNGDDQYTVSGGLIETFTIDAAGSYEMQDTISGGTATITVS